MMNERGSKATCPPDSPTMPVGRFERFQENLRNVYVKVQK